MIMAPPRSTAIYLSLALAAMMLPAYSPNSAAQGKPMDHSATDIKIVALGASNTAGWGVGEENAYPTQLQAVLWAKGYHAQVLNAGKSFDTTTGMLARLDAAVPPGTSIVIVQPGGNDTRFFGTKRQRTENLAAIEKRMQARNIKVIIFENTIVPSDLYQWDGIHFTREGHKVAASYLASRVMALIGGAESHAQSK